MAESTEAQGQVTEDRPGAQTQESPATPKTQSSTQTESKSQPDKAKDKGPSPWLKDLEGLGLAPEHLSAVDEYLGTQWQPRMTQYEQQAAEWSNLFGGDLERAQIMANIAAALEQDPEGTYRQIGELLELVDPSDDGAQPQPSPEGEQPPAEGEQQVDDPRLSFLDELMQERQMAQADQMYQDMMTKMSETYGPGFDDDLFNTALLAFGGDVEAADAWYAQRHQPAPVPDDPPPTSGEPVAPAPEEKQRPAKISDAVKNWVSDRDARRAA